jgi:hypothetical protein
MIPLRYLRAGVERIAGETRLGLPSLVAVLALTQLLAPAAPTGASPPASEEMELECLSVLRGSLLRGRGELVRNYRSATHCREEVYQGPRTRLYSDRPYHTAEKVDVLAGLAFCMSERHGTRSWTIEVSKPTEIHVLGTEAYGLEQRGWKKLDARVLVDAAGEDFDSLYSRTFQSGRYVIRQGFSSTAPLVFWRPDEVQILRD